jgi:hypothetical protein
VEDRCTSRLYLELGEGSEAEGAERADVLARLPGVSRATWWNNCLPGRSELPMRVTDGSLLVVAELQDDAVVPDPRPGSTAFSFRRHPRPSQGILTGRTTSGLLVVWISPRTPDLAAKLRDWGDFVHIRHIAAAGIPGFTQISVFENETAPDPRFMHFYEFDSEDAEATYQTMVDFVSPRLGGIGSEQFADWADWRNPGGRLWYCNTFNLAGDTGPDSRTRSGSVASTSP